MSLLMSCSTGEEATDNKKGYITENTLNLAQKNSTIEKVVGTYDVNGNPTMTMDTLEIRTLFQNQLKHDGVTTTLNKIQLRRGIVGGTSKEYYYLLGVNNDSSVKIATGVIPSPTLVRTLIVLLRSPDFLNSTCTCNGCRRGCTPSYFENSNIEFEWECTECQVGDINDCRKTVTATP